MMLIHYYYADDDTLIVMCEAIRALLRADHGFQLFPVSRHFFVALHNTQTTKKKYLRLFPLYELSRQGFTKNVASD